MVIVYQTLRFICICNLLIGIWQTLCLVPYGLIVPLPAALCYQMKSANNTDLQKN